MVDETLLCILSRWRHCHESQGQDIVVGAEQETKRHAYWKGKEAFIIICKFYDCLLKKLRNVCSKADVEDNLKKLSTFLINQQ